MLASANSGVARPRLAPVAVGLIGASWFAVAGVLARSDSAAAAVPIGCPVKALTGLDCPGCGSTRSLGALTQFDLVAAFDHNVLVPFVAVFVLASFVAWSAAVWRRDRDAGRDRPVVATDLVRRPDLIVGIGVALVAFAVLRNLDAAAWLASGRSGS